LNELTRRALIRRSLTRRSSADGRRDGCPNPCAGQFLQYRQATLEDVQSARSMIESPAAAIIAQSRDDLFD